MGIQHLMKTAEYSDDVVIVDDALLRRIQNDLLCMMKDINEVLSEEGISWWLSGGSVLGSVRHQGFIPWDDDIDIFMLRKDFERLKHIFPHTLGDKYILKIPGDKDYPLNLPQIQKKGTKLIPIQSTKNETDGLFIDIFILENAFNNKLLRCIHGAMCTTLLFIDSSMRMHVCGENIVKYTGNNAMIKHEVKRRAKYSVLFRFFPLEKWLKLSDNAFSLITKKTKYLVCPSGARHYFGEIFPAKMFSDAKIGSFETERWPLPNTPEKYLTIRYGNDFMKEPDIGNRERHVYAKVDLGG